MSWLFRRLDVDVFESSEFTRTGWNLTDQHGGPPSALMAHAIEARELPAPMQIARMAVSLIRPVPITRLRVGTRVVKAGRRVALVEASLTPVDGDDVVAVASAQLIRTGEIELGDTPRLSYAPPPPPEAGVAVDHGAAAGGWEDTTHHRFHVHAAEIRSIDRGWETPGAGTAWFRLAVDVIVDEPTSATVRFTALADLANGLSSALDYGRFMWVNPDMTVALARPPSGEWFGMTAETNPQSTGTGLVHAAAFDASGPFGHVLQTQLLEARP